MFLLDYFEIYYECLAEIERVRKRTTKTGKNVFTDPEMYIEYYDAGNEYEDLLFGNEL